MLLLFTILTSSVNIAAYITHYIIAMGRHKCEVIACVCPAKCNANSLLYCVLNIWQNKFDLIWMLWWYYSNVHGTTVDERWHVYGAICCSRFFNITAVVPKRNLKDQTQTVTLDHRTCWYSRRSFKHLLFLSHYVYFYYVLLNSIQPH